MGRVESDHFHYLIYGQSLWKEKFTKKKSKEIKCYFFPLSGYSEASLFWTFSICNALIKSFNRINQNEYRDIFSIIHRITRSESCRLKFEFF